MISFRFNEIPKGFSEENLSVGAEEIGIERSDIGRILLRLEFNKEDQNLRIKCHIKAEATFICDRSLEPFDTRLYSDYELVFQQNVKDEKEELSGALRRLDPSHNVIDITRELRDTVLLSIPIKKLHPGYYRDGSETGFEASFGNNAEQHDPRWDALTKLKQKIQKN